MLLDKLPALRASGAGSLARIVDVRAGYQHKRTSVVLSPGLPEATAENFDWGLAGRVALVPGAMDGRSTRLEFAGGLAEINADESSHFTLPGYGDIGPSTRIRRTGVAAHAVLPFGADPGPDGDSAPWSWWPASLPSAVELGLAYDREERMEGGAAAAEIADHWGFEGSFMRILFARAGYLLDEVRQLHHVSAGLGLHAPIGPWATVGYDWANVPVGNGLKNQNRHGFSAWLHPAAIWKAWRRGS